MRPFAIEPASDLAVLGALDRPEFPSSSAAAFEDFCATTEPVPLALEGFELFVPVDAYVFSHNKGILLARVQQTTLGASALFIEVNDTIDGGTSGSPVVTGDGRLLGIASSTGASSVPIPECFLGPPEDVRSSYSLEVAMSEFECQGLELDWVGVCWGDDLTIGADGEVLSRGV